MNAEADIDVINRANDAIERHDVDELERLLHPDVVWEHNIGEGSPEEGIYRGTQEVMGLYRRISDTWRQMTIRPQEVREVGRGCYELRGDMSFIVPGSEMEIAIPFVQRIEVRDGLATHVRLNVSRSVAAGTSEEGTEPRI